MKKILFGLTVAFAMLSKAQTSFTVGTNSIQAVFTDTQLSQTNRVLICNDLNRVFAFESNFTNLITYFDEPDGEQIGYLKEVTDNIYPFKALPGVKKTGSQYALLIRENISKHYVKCFAEMVSQTNLLKKADEFVAMLNAGEAANLTVEQKEKLCWVPAKYDQGTLEDSAMFAGSLSGFKFYPPSILSAEWLEVDDFPGRHFMMAVIAAPKNDLKKVFDMTIVYDGTQWRFVSL